MKKFLAVVAFITISITVSAQLVHPGDIVYVNQGDTASVKRSVMPAFVTKTHPAGNLIDIIYWEGNGNEWKYTEFPHLTITQVYENGYGYITKAEAIQYGIIDMHTYLVEDPDPLPIDFTKKLINGKFDVQNSLDTVGVAGGKLMTEYAAMGAIATIESEMFSGAWGDLTGVPSTFTPSSHTHAYSSLTSVPSTFQPSAHSHAPSDIVSAPWLTSFTEVDGSVTNEIPVVVSTPSSGNAITMSTAFQPRSGGACHLTINASLTGALGLVETITVAMSATSGGTYTTVATDVLLIGLLGLTLDRSVASIPVPAGYWVRVTRSGSAASATYTRWDY